METTKLTVTGMSCGHCADAVENALRSQPGVRSVKVNLAGGAAEVEHEEGAVEPEELIAAVKEEGYGASLEGSATGWSR
jgi:copper chaperone